jgi:hypothetical protein
MALSRLYAVQLLSKLCGDFVSAADWLADGGAGLSEEQQEVRQGCVDMGADGGTGVMGTGVCQHGT